MKKKHEEEHENHERWLVSYADFITLLFAFFTVLYATSQKDVKKEKEFENSIRAAFQSFMDFGGFMGAGDNPPYDRDASMVPPPLELFKRQGLGSAELENLLKGLLKKELSAEDLQKVVSNIRHDSVGVRVSLASASIFSSGSAKLSSEALVALDKIATVLNASGRKLLVEGHTDDIPINSGVYPTNWELSSARATTIVRYLIQKHGVNPARLVVVAYADQKPVVPNTNDENRAKNRRIEILMINDGAAKTDPGSH